MKKKLYISLFILLPLTIAAGNYTGFVEQLVQYLKFYNQNYPQEKIYIQTDKTFYKQNEHVWYKAFLLNSENNRASDVSDVVYVELRDPKGNVVAKRELRMLNGVSNGDFLIGENAAGGLYSLVAYTNWQKNWGEELFFKKEITVQKVITPRLLLKLDFEKRAYGAGDSGIAILSVSDLKNVKTTDSRVKAEVKIGGKTVQTIETVTKNGEARIAFRLPDNLNTSDGLLQVIVNDKGVEESVSRSIPIVLNKISLQFFPEGGDLIENVNCKVAFKAVNEFGKGADISGKIIDENNVEVAAFESFHLGMGAFNFMPRTGKNYFAKIEKPQGNHAPVQLPQAKEFGYSLNLISQDKNILTWSIYAPENNRVSLVGQTQGVIYYGKEINLQAGYNTIRVDLKDFPVGVAVFTLFDEKYRETCERLVYVNPQNGLQIAITTDKDAYKPLENVQLTIKTTDKDNRPVAASLGVSVVDEQLIALADDKQDNLLSYILFSSELKGKIQEPSFYFDKNEKKANEAIDFLMLTHGWRRFTWQDVLKPQKKVFKESAEKLNDIYGYVLDVNDKPKQVTIHLIEYGGKQRVAKLKTTPEGHFAFRNVDFSGRVLLTVPLFHKIYFFKGKPHFFQEVNFEGMKDFNFEDLKEEKEKQDENILSEEKIKELLELIEIGDDDVLNDVVVAVGYGTQAKGYAGSAQSIRAEMIERKSPSDITRALAGEFAGVQVVSGGQPGETSNIRIRGIGSINAGTAPLYVVDGIPYWGDIEHINQNDIASVVVLSDATSTSLYGARGANGVILITTKQYVFGYYKDKPKYSGLFVPKKEFYKPTIFEQNIHNKNQENTTVYWNADVTTDKNGEATLTFKNNNISSSFRITAEGVSASNGLIGSNIHKIATTQPFSIDVKTPLFASLGDIVRLPVLLKNTTKETIEAEVNLILPDALLPLNGQAPPTSPLNPPQGDFQVLPTKSVVSTSPNFPPEGGLRGATFVKILPESTQTIYLGFTPTREQGEHEYTITATAPNYSEKITRKVTIRSVYFPQSQSLSGRKMSDILSFEKGGEMIDGSFSAKLVCYTNANDELFAGLASILREPYGCFEQVSSSNFPNIMALQAMQASGNIDEKTQKRALELLDNGYKKLAGYEVSGGGFDWYGKPPASTALTAYGVIQFYEMEKVYKNVDAKMTERARKFLLDCRDGKGNFKNQSLRYAFSETSQEVCNAYVVYALSEVRENTDFNKEYQYALQEAFSSKDMYRMALMANAAYNRNDRENYNKLMQHFENEIKKNDFEKMQIQTSITHSGGNSLKMETVALWTIALLKDMRNIEMIDKCINYISSNRLPYGSFGNTQSTILCLQALTNYANNVGKVLEFGKINLSINGQNTELDLTKKPELDKQMALDITKFFVQGDNSIELKFVDMKKSLPYNFQFTWEYKTPSNNGLCPFVLKTELNRNVVKRNETVRLAITLENKEPQDYPMSVAIIGIPGGMSLQAWQLKEMQEQEVFDFYEIIDDNLVLYYRNIKAKERKTVNLDLKAEIPGTYTGMASTTYVYYTNENKYWVKGLEVKVEE